MADRYWVGGAGTWDATAGTKWSTTDGGTGGAAIPTASDDVYFTALSGTVTVTMGTTNSCLSLICTGFTGTISNVTGYNLNVSGSLTLSTTMTLTPTTGWQFQMVGATVGGSYTITTAGKTMPNVSIIVAATATVTLQDAFTSAGPLTVSQGIFSTGNYNVTATQIVSVASNTRTMNFGSSTINLSGLAAINLVGSITGLTINAGTSTINITSSSSQISTGGQFTPAFTFYNVNFTNTTADSRTINGAFTFNNLSIAGPSSVGVVTANITGNKTINGTLSTTGTAGNRRVFFASANYGIGWTLTCNSAASLTDADFRDIYVTGTSAPISGTRIGNRGNCSGITFSAPKTVYWNLAGAQNWSANAWATTPTGTPSTDNFPLPQDTATFTNAGSVTGTITFDSAITFKSSVDMSARTTAMTLSLANSTVWYGDWKNGSGTTLSGAAAQTFSGGGTQTITSAGKTFSCPVTVDTYGGTVQLADALIIADGFDFTVTNGTFDTKNYNLTSQILFSSNTNVRTITLGSSTVTLTGGTVINFSTGTNITFNAGTSSIVCTGTSALTVNQGIALTFYNFSTTSASGISFTASEPLTFNNLTINAPASTGISLVTFFANLNVNGTLTCSGASAIRRSLLRSNTLGTQRDLTVGTLVANDCDFRDIKILGTAIGAAPTRAGDCGNNANITFPSPKTVYWNLAGTQNWSATGWATSSGGSPGVNNFPLAQDTVIFDDAGSAGTVTINANWNIGTFNAGARTSAVTITNNISGSCFLYGNLTLAPGGTYGGIFPYSMGKVGTQTITSNGRALVNNVNIQRPQTTVVLTDALNMSGRTILHQAGTFDAATYNVTMGTYTGGGTSTLYMGSGTWTIDDVSGTYWTVPATLYVGTSTIVLSNGFTFARIFDGGGQYYNKLTIGGTTDTFTLTISGNNTFGELASTKTVAYTIAFGSTTQTFGKWSVTGTVGNVVTITGTSTTNLIAGPAVTGVDYLAMGTWGVSTTSPGEFYAGANSTGTAAAPVFRTAAPTPRNLYWVGGTGNWSSTTKWATSSGGASGAAIPTSLDTVTFDSASNATAYTATIDAGVTIARCAAFTMAGPASGNVTFAGSVPIAYHGTVSFAATGITRTYSAAMNLVGNSSYTFTTNGVSIASPIVVVGVGATWALGSSLGSANQSVTVTCGAFNTNNYTYTYGTIIASPINVVSISLGSSALNISGLNVVNFTGSSSTVIPANLTFNAGTSTITQTGSGNTTVYAGGKTFYNFIFTNANNASLHTVHGVNTFNNLTIPGLGFAGIATVAFSANQIINGTLTLTASGFANGRTFIRSDALGTARTLTVNALAAGAADIDFRDITVTGAAAPLTGTRFGDAKGNSGITFPAAKTVYYRQTGSANWGGNSWSATSGGAFDATQFPLAQDTAVFPAATYPASGSTTTINDNYNIGTIDMSLRTSNTMTLSTGTTTPQIYGNWINGTGITFAGTGAMTFAGRGSQTITSAGRTFTQDMVFWTPGGSITLLDSFISNRASGTALQQNQGTFDANGYNVTLSSGGFFSNSALTRTAAVGSGTWVLGGSGTVWTSNATNFTVTGAGTISLTNASAKQFTGGNNNYSSITLNQGGTGNLTITGNNTFANITDTAVGATTISLGATTQRVGAFAASGTAGNLLTVTGTSAASPATLIYTGAGAVPELAFVVPTSLRAYPVTSTWSANNGSVNGGSLGFTFSNVVPVVYTAGGNFMAFF